MSYIAFSGGMFAILNEKGYYELEIQVSTMRVTQNAGEFDKIVIIAPVNVVRTKEEMQNQLTKWKK